MFAEFLRHRSIVGALEMMGLVEKIALTVKRKIWRPRGSKDLAISIPAVDFLKEGDDVDVSITTLERLVVQKSMNFQEKRFIIASLENEVDKEAVRSNF